MNIATYVKRNYDKLPKSTFNDEELVIVLQIRNEDHGYGSHSYEGIGIDRDGKVFWCFSSGCSCDGTCGIEQGAKDLKKFEVEGYDLSKMCWQEMEFSSMQVDFRDYT